MSALHAKGSLAGVTLNDKIFAIGGGAGSTVFSEVEMFDPALGRWTDSLSMRQHRFTPAAAEYNGALYVTGGYDGNMYLQSAERYDPREGFLDPASKYDSKKRIPLRSCLGRSPIRCGRAQWKQSCFNCGNLRFACQFVEDREPIQRCERIRMRGYNE